MGVVALVHLNFDLLLLGIAIAGLALLGFIIFFNNPQSATNRIFSAFALWNVIWGISNYLEYKLSTIEATLWALRIHLFFSCWYALLFFTFAYVFPEEKVTFPRWYWYALIPIIGTTSILTLTPFVFSGIPALAPAGYVTNPTRGPGIIIFSIVAFGLLIAGVATIVYKAVRSTDADKRKQEYTVSIGMAATAALILLFNVLLPIFFDQLSFIPLAALFMLPFIALISYSIYRYHLFNLKVATTAFLGFLVTVFSFVNVVYSTSFSAVIVNTTAFLVVLLGSIKIVQDTLALEELAENLTATNERQEGLLHFISHEVKGFLTKDEGAFAAISEGDLGACSPELKTFAEHALAQTRQGVASVTDLLQAANQKKGTVSYQMAPFDFKALVAEAVEKARGAATAKGLALSFTSDDAQTYQVVGDAGQIRDHVLRNLIDNAVNYTLQGSVAVTLTKEAGKIIFAVKDTGVGITDEDKTRLFTEGGHGKDSIKVNVHSTGYGLFIAKHIVDAHKGTIRAESEGPGKGSRFVVELPA